MQWQNNLITPEIATHLSGTRNDTRGFSLLLHNPKGAHCMLRVTRAIVHGNPLYPPQIKRDKPIPYKSKVTNG